MFHVKQCKIRRKRGSKTRRGVPTCVCRRRGCERACCGKKKSASVRADAAQCAGKGGMARKTSERTVLDRRVQGNFLRTGVAKWRKSDEMAAKRYNRRFVTGRCDGRFSYNGVDNGGDRRKYAEKINVEEKIFVEKTPGVNTHELNAERKFVTT